MPEAVLPDRNSAHHDPASRAGRVSLILLALLLLSVAIRVPFFRVPLGPDEGSYAYVARAWTSHYPLYRYIPFNRAPAIFLIYKAILALIGTDVTAVRLGGAIYNAVSLAAVFWLARAMFSRRAAWIAAAVYGITSAAPHVEGFTANLELFAMLPLILAAYCTWKEQWGRAGFAAGIAFLVKQIGLSGLLLALAWLIVVSVPLERTSWRDPARAFKRLPWRGLIRLGIGFSIGPLATAAYGVTIGWHYFWTSFVKHTFLTNSFLGKPLWYQAGSFAVLGVRTLPAWMVAGVLAALALRTLSGRARAFGLLWLLTACFGIWMGGGPWRHYFVQLVPTLAVFSGPGLLALPHLRRRWRWQALLVLGFGAFIVWELPLWFMSPQETNWRLYKSHPQQLAPQVAAYVKAQTGPQDSIYVAFSQAQIYYLADRRAQPVQLFWYEAANSPAIFDEVLDAIDRRVPAMIVWVQPPPAARMTFEAFAQRIQQGYVEARRFGSGDPRTGGIIVYRRR